MGIESGEFRKYVDQFAGDEVIVVNLAARFDFGATPLEYYKSNVECHQSFTAALSKLKVKKFIHVSSVAALDGRNINFSEQLSCDDAYRATKYLQEALIENGVVTAMWRFQYFIHQQFFLMILGQIQILGSFNRYLD